MKVFHKKTVFFEGWLPLAVGSGAVLVLGLDPFPRTALSGSRHSGDSFGYQAERSLLNECVREALWSRVLPLSGCLALAFRQASRWGIISSHRNEV